MMESIVTSINIKNPPLSFSCIVIAYKKKNRPDRGSPLSIVLRLLLTALLNKRKMF